MKIVLSILISTFFAFNVNAQNNIDSIIPKRIPGGVEVTFYISKEVFAKNELKKDFGFMISYYVYDTKTASWELRNFENNKISVGVDHLFVRALILENTTIQDVRLTLHSSEFGLPNSLTKLEANAMRIIEKI